MLTQLKYILDLETTRTTYYYQSSYGLLGLQGYVWLIMGSEVNDEILDVHHYSKTNCFLCCSNVVTDNQKEVMCKQTH